MNKYMIQRIDTDVDNFREYCIKYGLLGEEIIFLDRDSSSTEL